MLVTNIKRSSERKGADFSRFVYRLKDMLCPFDLYWPGECQSRLSWVREIGKSGGAKRQGKLRKGGMEG